MLVTRRSAVARRRLFPLREDWILAVETLVSFEMAVDSDHVSVACLGVVLSSSTPWWVLELEGLGVRPAISGMHTRNAGWLRSCSQRVAVQHSRDAVFSNTSWVRLASLQRASCMFWKQGVLAFGDVFIILSKAWGVRGARGKGLEASG